MNLQAVFLDRDGVINNEIGLVVEPKNLKLIPGAAEAIRKLNEAGLLAIVVTNQPVVVRGLASIEKLESIHSHLKELLAQQGASLNAIYYCPHHPGPIIDPHPDTRYLKDCSCRKPKIGLLERAQSDFRLEPRRCVFIGDATRDIQAGRSFGCRTILVKTGHSGQDRLFEVKPDLICLNLLDAVDQILKD